MASFNQLGPFAGGARSVVRAAKNYTKGYSDIQVKVRKATSSDPWGPSGSECDAIAQATYNQQDFIEIMEMLDKRLNDNGKNWRHVFKSLTLLDYLLHSGSENVILYFQENMYIIKTLREFVYVDDNGKDEGANIRAKAKEITALLMDEARMKEQRRARSNMRDRMAGYPTRESRDSDDDEENEARRNRVNKRETRSKEDEDLQKALEESRRMAAAEESKSKRNRQAESELEEALRLSREEEEKRKRQLAGLNSSLFDPDNPSNGNSSNFDSLIDFNAEPQQQQQQQPQMQMPMITGFPTTQFQSFNPYYQQQQEELMRQQQMMEMQRQMQEQEAYNQMMAQQAYQQQQQQAALYQQQLAAQQAAMQQQQQMQPLMPQHTAIGSNNPFAAFAKPTSPPPMPTQEAPPLAARPASTPVTQQQRPPRDDGKYAHLANLLGNRDDGIDTFGNQGALRYGQAAGRVMAQQTGTNPFQRQQQQQQQQRNDQPLLDL